MLRPVTTYDPSRWSRPATGTSDGRGDLVRLGVRERPAVEQQPAVADDPHHRRHVLPERRAELLGDGGDFTFLTGCCERMGEAVWREEVVATVRPAT